MPRFKAACLTVMMAMLLAFSLPAPAKADLDLSFLSNMFQGLLSGITNLFNGTMTAAAGNIAALSEVANTIGKGAEYTGTAINTATQNHIGSDLTRTVEPPSDTTCQIAANALDEGPRFEAEDETVTYLTSVLDHLYINPLSGKIVGKNQINKALCALGATGKKGECTVEITTPADKMKYINGADWNITRPVIENKCIPMDVKKLKVEIDKIAALKPTDTYSLSDPNMQEAVVAMLVTRLNRKLSIDPIPSAKENETLSGLENTVSLKEKISQNLASAEPIFRAMAWNSCFSTAMLPSCASNNSDLLKRLSDNNVPHLPPSGYCLSATLKTEASVFFYADQMANHIGDHAGTKYESFDVAMTIQKEINDSKKRRAEVMKAAADAAQVRPDDTNIGLSARPTSQNEIEDLKESIRKLTRVIEEQQHMLPRALDAKLKLPAHKAEESRGEPVASRLPPLRQDIPAVQ